MSESDSHSNSESDSEFAEWLEVTLQLRGIAGNSPSRLYKFLSSESKYFPLAMHELLLHSRLYLSSRRDFNDPMDTRFGLDIPDHPEEISEFVQGIASRAPAELIPSAEGLRSLSDPSTFADRFAKNLSDSLDGVGIYSMSESVSHPLMWAHYAASHQGIALMFRLGTSDESIGAAYPIRYQGDYPRSPLRATGLQIHLMLTKGLAWEYEREWRIAEGMRAGQWIEIEPGTLMGIVFGAKASEETWRFVIDLLKRRVAAGLPRLVLCRSEVNESFDLTFLQLVAEGKEERWVPVALE